MRCLFARADAIGYDASSASAWRNPRLPDMHLTYSLNLSNQGVGAVISFHGHHCAETPGFDVDSRQFRSSQQRHRPDAQRRVPAPPSTTRTPPFTHISVERKLRLTRTLASLCVLNRRLILKDRNSAILFAKFLLIRGSPREIDFKQGRNPGLGIRRLYHQPIPRRV